jgi:nucleoside-diphosphate-sugar epimerase
LDRPFSSDDLPRPVDAYGVSKAEAESGLFDVGAKTGLEIVVVRAPLVYGPGVKANFAAIVAAIRRGWPLPFGSVTANRRSMVALDSLVDLLALCAVHPAAPGQVFFASDGDDVSTAELIRRIARALDRNPRLLAIPSALLAVGALAVGKGAVARRLLGSLRVDIGPTHALLGWSPPVTMAEALRETVAALSRSSEKGMTTE